MSVVVGSAVAYLELDASKFESGMQKSKKSLEATGQSLTKVGGALRLGLTVPITAFATASVKAADALRQTQRKSNVIFGEMTKDVQAWSLENERTFGLGAGTIEGFTGKIADLTQGMGLGKKESLDMAKGAMQLGVQLGNWNGVGADVAMDDLTAAIAGSHKAMEKYGVKLNQTVLDEKTRKMGLGDTFNKLTEAQKAEVRYQAIIEASGNAIEFWNEGNRSTAFYLNEIKEQIGNCMEVIGGLFLPILDKVVKVMADWVSNIAAFLSENPAMVKGIALIGGVLAALGPGMMIVGKLMTIFSAAGAAATGLGILAGAVAVLGISFLGMNENAQEALLDLPFKAQQAIAQFLQKIVETLPDVLNKGLELAFKLMEGFANGVPVFLQFVWDSLLHLCGLLFNFGPKFLTIGFDFIKNMLDGAIQKFPEFLGKMMDGILNVLANIRAELPEFLQNGIEFVGEMIKGIATNIPNIIAKIGELLVKLIAKIVEYLPKFLAEGFKIVGEIIKGLWDNKGALLQMGVDLIKGLWDSIMNIAKSFINVGKAIVDGIKNGISNAWGSFTSWVTGKMKSIPIIGKLFTITPPAIEDNEIFNEYEKLKDIKFSYSKANEVIRGGLINSLYSTIASNIESKDLKIEEKKSKAETIAQTVNINLNVDKMMNTDNKSIEDIADELAFYIRRKRLI